MIVHPRNSLLIAVTIVILFTWRHSDFYFGPPIHETGDFAANALQIDDARSFKTLYGNYSRWRFNHPGPGFFYVYAASEALLHRTIPFFASPHQAHAFGGLMLQAGFFAIGLGVLARHARSSLGWIFPFAVAMLYFRGVEGAFTSIWAPHVLMAPFFAFLCCCGAIANGDTRDLPLAALSGSFLVHGHVAQPLFVIPLFCCAYLCLTYSARREAGAWPWRQDLRSHAIGGTVLFIFTLPIVIDVFSGSDSNFSRILGHLSRHEDGGKSLFQSLGHLISFFVHDRLPEQSIDAASYSLAAYSARHWAALAVWIGAAAVAVLALCPRSTGNETQPGLKSRRVTAVVWLAAVLLTLVWGMRQDGEMFAFNSFFVHALVFLLVLLALDPVLDHFQNHGPRAAAALFLLVSFLDTLGGAPQPVYSQPQSEIEIPARVRAALDRDGRDAVHLDFEHSEWPGVVSVALALQREGTHFTVDSSWRFMFGFRHEAKPDAPFDRTWRIRRIGTQENEVQLTRNLAFVELRKRNT